MSWVDSCDLEYALAEFKAENERLQAENDSLRKELAVTNPLFETLNAANDRLIYENMKLRELVRISIEHCNSGTCDGCTIQDDDGSCPYAEIALKLGIEVDG
jgi:regulator of replication initiation timing